MRLEGVFFFGGVNSLDEPLGELVLLKVDVRPF